MNVRILRRAFLINVLAAVVSKVQCAKRSLMSPHRKLRFLAVLFCLGSIAWFGAAFGGAAQQRQPDSDRLGRLLERYSDADLNQDGTLTVEEARTYLSQRRAGRTRGARASSTGRSSPEGRGGSRRFIEIEVSSEDPVPINPRVYGIICEEMFVSDLVDEPEYLDALRELEFKTFLYPGGSITYYHHPEGTGGFNIQPEEVMRSKHGARSRFMKENQGPDHFEQFIRFVKASDGAAIFVANIVNGTVAELDRFLSRLEAEGIPIAAVVLGVEMHLGQGRSLGLEGYVKRIEPYIQMLQADYPGLPIVAHSTPVGRMGGQARASFHEWNRTLARIPGISGFSQYGWTEFGGQRRLQTKPDAASATDPAEIWQHYDEFVRNFPQEQISAYQEDWGEDKKMYLLQWGTHADANTAVQGMHIANFYFFLVQYNAKHDDYFPAATSALILARDVSRSDRTEAGILYKEKISLRTPYLYTRPFRHLFGGDKKLLTASVSADGGRQASTVKVLAAVNPKGQKFIYLLNSGPTADVKRLAIDGVPAAPDSCIQIESVFANSAASRDSSAPPAETLMAEAEVDDLVLEPFSLTVLISCEP